MVIPVLLGVAAEEAGQRAGMSSAEEQPEDFDAVPDMPVDPNLWLYRDRTLGMLRRYHRMSVEAGRLPSLLGRELFDSKVTEYRSVTFEDCIIFVHDMERSLAKLDFFSRSVMEAVVFQEYSQDDAAELLHCRRRTVARCYIEGLDRLTDILLETGLLDRLVEPEELEEMAVENFCQGGPEGNISASYYKEGENKFERNVTISALV
jgi:hypothetical protein